MAHFQIISSEGVDMGTYEAGSAHEAVEAMWRDAGWTPGRSAIRDLRDESCEAGDENLHVLCVRALSGEDAEAYESVSLYLRDVASERLTVLLTDA
jgi:hypothetical protein